MLCKSVTRFSNDSTVATKYGDGTFSRRSTRRACCCRACSSWSRTVGSDLVSTAVSFTPRRSAIASIGQTPDTIVCSVERLYLSRTRLASSSHTAKRSCRSVNACCRTLICDWSLLGVSLVEAVADGIVGFDDG